MNSGQDASAARAAREPLFAPGDIRPRTPVADPGDGPQGSVQGKPSAKGGKEDTGKKSGLSRLKVNFISGGQTDFTLLAAATALVIFGVVMIFSSS